MKTVFATLLLVFGLSLMVQAKDDAGKQPVGKLKVTLYFGTNEGKVNAGAKAKEVSSAVKGRLTAQHTLKFKNYRELGADTQDVLRSYENWAAPLRPSEAILMSFQPRKAAAGRSIQLDLELWQSKRKIMRSSPNLSVGKPLYILGPSWRGGKLIIAVELLSLK